MLSILRGSWNILQTGQMQPFSLPLLRTLPN